MSTSAYESACREIRNMRPWQIIALSAVCAEKVAPIIRFLALPETWAVARKCLEFAWSSTTDANPSVEEAARLRQALASMPEWQCDYPDSLPSVVTRVLSFSEFALTTITAASDSEKAKYVGFSLMLETAELFDLAREQHPAFEKPKKRIEKEEESSQQSLIEIVRRQDWPSQQITDALRQEAKRMSDLFEEALPVYCYHIIWTLIRTAAAHSGSA